MNGEVCVDPNGAVTDWADGEVPEGPNGEAVERTHGEGTEGSNDAVADGSNGAATERADGAAAEGQNGEGAERPHRGVAADPDAVGPTGDDDVGVGVGVDVRIVRGTPDETELAALLAVLTAVAGHRGTARTGGRSHLSCRAHWDRAWGGGLHPCGSWRVRDRTVTAFDPDSR
ncbi:acyl-CoA carboxylase epsilon subunit [Streptomyces sp. NPDC127084]|uniref:acyl-CoA carboxylase epsilon subunit n=1 Tax=Streptomyces sp. NPDC127084 TaxID=3347133 RepID=UPI003652C25B